MKNIFILILIISFTVSCKVPEGSYRGTGWAWGQAKYNNYDVKVISEPTGAVVEWDNEYMGKTPITISVSGVYTIVVVQATLNGRKQSKILSSPFPKTVYFNFE